jgi:Spy/CpxP family protein refolding chaperone
MKSFKAILTAVTLSVALIAPLKAQEKKGGMSPEARIEQIEKAVGSLTDAQKEKIKTILEEVRSAPKEERKQKGQEANAKIRSVLTADQQAKFDAMPQGGGGKKKKN